MTPIILWLYDTYNFYGGYMTPIILWWLYDTYNFYGGNMTPIIFMVVI